MSGDRVPGAAFLTLLAALATVGVFVLDAGTPLRIAAGTALLLALPWMAASRLAPLRENDLAGGRFSAAGAVAIALVVLLGLLLVAGGNGIATHGIAVGMLIVTAILAAIGRPGDGPLPRPALDGRSLLGLALTATAIAIAVFAFVVARERALTQAREATPYAAFLSEDSAGFDLGLSNSSHQAAVFTVRDAGKEDGAETRVAVPARSTRTVRDFVSRPPALRPRERLAPHRIEPLRIHIVVTVDGERRGPVLTLSTYAR